MNRVLDVLMVMMWAFIGCVAVLSLTNGDYAGAAGMTLLLVTLVFTWHIERQILATKGVYEQRLDVLEDEIKAVRALKQAYLTEEYGNW